MADKGVPLCRSRYSAVGSCAVHSALLRWPCAGTARGDSIKVPSGVESPAKRWLWSAVLSTAQSGGGHAPARQWGR
jgi:hypothetical protein